MKAVELRIGNLISMPFLGNPVLIVVGLALTENGKTFIQAKDKSSIFFELPEKYNPIPLTEEWLLKFGFEKMPNKDYFTIYLSDKDENEFGRQRIDYWFGGDDFSAAELCRSGVCFKRVKINYVHQIQNLYFALTQTELIYETK